jgi:hypothetical protein
MAKPLGPKAAVQVIERLFDRYGLDRKPDRDRSKDGEAFQQALFLAARDGLLKVPLRKQGNPAKWIGARGLKLVERVEEIRIEGRKTAAAIRHLQDTDPEWSAEDDLDKRYYDAKRHWTYWRRLEQRFGRLT